MSQAQAKLPLDLTPAQILSLSSKTLAEYSATARHHFKKGEYEQSKHAFEMICYLNPKDAHALMSLGLVHQALQEWDDAIACYRQSYLQNPLSDDAKVLWAEALCFTQDVQNLKPLINAGYVESLSSPVLKERATTIWNWLKTSGESE